MESCSLDKNMLKPLEDQLRCRICSEFYNDCVMAVCSHNFCSVCIKKRLESEDDCPNCFEVVQESDLRSNKILDKLVRFYKKIHRNRSKGKLESQNQRIIPAPVQSNPPVQIDPDLQIISVQNSAPRTVNFPERETSKNSPLIHSLRPRLTDSTYPVKLESVENNESDMNDAVMSSNSVEDSSGADVPKKRKRKKPQRYMNESSSEVEDENILPEISKKKKSIIPSIPIHKASTNSCSNIDVFESATSWSDSNSESTLVPKKKIFKQNEDSQVLLRRILEGQAKLERGLKKLEEMFSLTHDSTMGKLSHAEGASSSALAYVLPENVKLPLLTDEDLINFNTQLTEDKDFQMHMIHYLHLNCTGRTLTSFLTSILKKLLVKEVAVAYSRLGRKGKKSFELLKEVFTVVTAAAALKFQEVQREEINDKFGRVLANSNDWERRRISLENLTFINNSLKFRETE